MHPDYGETKKKLADKIAITHRINAVLTEARKTELARDQFAINDNGRSSERAGTERENISPRETISKTTVIALECFDLCEQVMGKKDWLGALQMSVTGHDKIDMFFGETKQGALQIPQARRHFRDLRLDVETQIERDLIVAAARRVQFRTSGANSFRQRRFDVHVDILERLVPLKSSRIDFFLNFAQSVIDLTVFIGRNDAGLREGGSMRERASDVVPIKPPIK